MLALTVLLENEPQYFLNSLPSIYLVGKATKKTLDDLHVLLKIKEYYAEGLKYCFCRTPSELYYGLSKAFLTNGCFNYFSCLLCARGAAASGRIDLVKESINRGASNIDCIASKAARHDHLDILLFALDSGASDWNRIVSNAARGTNKCLLNMVLFRLNSEKEQKDWNKVVSSSAKGGNIINFRYVVSLSKDTIDWSRAIQSATKGGHLTILKYISDTHQKVNWGNVAIEVSSVRHSQKGHLEVFEFAIQRGIVNWERLAIAASTGGNLNIFNFALSKNVEFSVSTIYGIAHSSATGGCLEILKYTLDKGSMNWDIIAREASFNGHIEIVMLAVSILLESEEVEPKLHLNKIIKYAAAGGHTEIVKVLTHTCIFYNIEIDWTSVITSFMGNGYMWQPKMYEPYSIFTVEWNTVVDWNTIEWNTVVDWNSVAISVAGGGYIDLVKFATDRALSVDWDSIASISTYNGHINITKFAIENGPVEWVEITCNLLMNDSFSWFRNLIAVFLNNDSSLGEFPTDLSISQTEHLSLFTKCIVECDEEELIQESSYHDDDLEDIIRFTLHKYLFL